MLLTESAATDSEVMHVHNHTFRMSARGRVCTRSRSPKQVSALQQRRDRRLLHQCQILVTHALYSSCDAGAEVQSCKCLVRENAV